MEIISATDNTDSCYGQSQWLYLEAFVNLKNLRRSGIHESWEIKNRRVKSKFDDSVKVLNKD